MKPPLFTVAVMGHQSERFLPRTLASVEAQTFRDFDVLCVVEESTDRSLELCREWAAAAPGRAVASLPKSGSVSRSRNYTIDHATGEYIVFVDGDDRILPEMLEKLAAKLAATGGVDMLSFAAMQTETDEVDPATAPKISNFRTGDATDVFTGLEAIRRAGRNRGNIHAYTWLNAWRTAFLRENRLYFLEGLALQDVNHTNRAWFAAKRCAYLDERFYVYRRRADSTTDTRSTRFIRNLFPVLRDFIGFEDVNDIPEDILRLWSNQWLSLLYWVVFHPVTSKRVTDAERAAGFAMLAEGGGAARFRAFVSRASFSKRLAMPFLEMAAKGRPRPARLFFRYFYFPLLALRDNVS